MTDHTDEKDAKPCVCCGEVRDDGPTASNGDVWCGDCYAEGVFQA
jgi:hypothetical protein